jgi:hypothetical protein
LCCCLLVFVIFELIWVVCGLIALLGWSDSVASAHPCKGACIWGVQDGEFLNLKFFSCRLSRSSSFRVNKWHQLFLCEETSSAGCSTGPIQNMLWTARWDYRVWKSIKRRNTQQRNLKYSGSY